MLNKQMLIGVFLALSALLSPYALAADVTMNVGWATPLDSDYGVLAKKFQELVAEYSHGEIEVKLRPSGQIAGEDEAFKAMQLGTVDGYFISQNNVSPHFPLMDVFQLPYIFQSTEHANAVFYGPVGDELKQLLLAETGVHLLTFGNISYRDLYNTQRPINTFEDFGGLKYRVPKNEVMIATFRAFGAEPVPLAWSETPTALQTGTIDGGDNGTSVILDMKFYEFAKHMAILEHFSGVSPLFASERFMSKLSEEQAAAVRKAADEAGKYQQEVLATATDDIRKKLAELGMAITYPDKTQFIAAAKSVQDEFAASKDDRFREFLQRVRNAAQ